MNGRTLSTILFVAALTSLGTPAHAKLDCVQLRDIDQTPVIDDKTILMKMTTRNHYKRVDLDGSCPDLLFEGYVRGSPDEQFCNAPPLRMFDGSFCAIKDIVDITPDEAKALLAHARDPHPKTDSKP